MAVALKLAVVPDTLVTLCGWAVKAGGTNTVRTATALVTEPARLVTTTE